MKINTVVLVVLFITHGSPFMLLYVCLSVLVGTYVLFLSPCFKPPPTCFKLISVVPFFFFFFFPRPGDQWWPALFCICFTIDIHLICYNPVHSFSSDLKGLQNVVFKRERRGSDSHRRGASRSFYDSCNIAHIR